MTETELITEVYCWKERAAFRGMMLVIAMLSYGVLLLAYMKAKGAC